MEKEKYPEVLSKESEMYKSAKAIKRDSAIFGERRALLERHFDEYPIYLDESYYARYDKCPKLVRENGVITTEGSRRNIAAWRDCHYYTLFEWQGMRFYVMTGGRYD